MKKNIAPSNRAGSVSGTGYMMKLHSLFRRLTGTLPGVLLGFCAIVGRPALLHAQESGPVSLFTTGGITYATYWWEDFTGGGPGSSQGPLIRRGTNFSFDLTTPALPPPGSVIGEACEWGYTAILGALAPGGYTLTTTSYSVPVATNTFTVPTNATPTLQPIGFAADGSFQIQINGAYCVDYVLQCSTDFKSWIPLSTNGMLWEEDFGAGPVSFSIGDASPVSPGSRFYRVILWPVFGSPDCAPSGPGDDGSRNN
jgi:hypothetical protein